MYEAGDRCDIGQTAMLSSTVTELTRGTAHPGSHATQIMLVALSLGSEPSVADARRVRATAPAHSDFGRRLGAAARVGCADEGSTAGEHTSHTSDPARWRGLQAA